MAENQTEELIRHIKKNISKGYKEESIKWALINQGYSRTAVERALRKALKEIDEDAAAKEKSKKDSEKPKITYQVYDQNNKIIYGKKSFWKKMFRK